MRTMTTSGKPSADNSGSRVVCGTRWGGQRTRPRTTVPPAHIHQPRNAALPMVQAAVLWPLSEQMRPRPSRSVALRWSKDENGKGGQVLCRAAGGRVRLLRSGSIGARRGCRFFFAAIRYATAPAPWLLPLLPVSRCLTLAVVVKPALARRGWEITPLVRLRYIFSKSRCESPAIHAAVRKDCCFQCRIARPGHGKESRCTAPLPSVGVCACAAGARRGGLGSAVQRGTSPAGGAGRRRGCGARVQG